MRFLLLQKRKDCNLITDEHVRYNFAELRCKPNNETWDTSIYHVLINEDAEIVNGRNENAEAYNDNARVEQCKQSFSILMPDVAFNDSCKQQVGRLCWLT
jgi:hypothetical protein